MNSTVLTAAAPRDTYVERREELTALIEKHEATQMISCYAYWCDGDIVLGTLRVKRAAPRGTGTAFMKELCELADKFDVMILVSPGIIDAAPRFMEYKATTSRQRVVEFYRRFGFVSRTASRTYRPELSESHYRLPREGA